MIPRVASVSGSSTTSMSVCASMRFSPSAPEKQVTSGSGFGLTIVVVPDASALLALVAAQLAQVDERVHDHPLAHAVGEIGVDHAHDRLIGESGIGEEMIHAGPKRENHSKVGKVFERARGMAPTQRIVDGLPVDRPPPPHALGG